MKISDLRREHMGIKELVLHLESNKLWSEIGQVIPKVMWLQNECAALVSLSEQIARQSLEQVRNHCV